ncbi:MAG: hypothetical protein HY360_19965 [Verrucomicrobia bacterium]|nr:hypothetical protein [Verrucomicrobiota bacterium]
MPSSLICYFFLLAMLSLLPLLGIAGNGLLEPDTPKIVAHNDVIYESPARLGWEGLPLGNGTFGAQVWQPDGLTFQFNTPLSGVYGGAIARLRFATAPGMLDGVRSYRQRLSLHDATLHTDITAPTGKISAVCFIPADTDALVIQYADTRPEAGEGLVELEAWRSSSWRATEAQALLLVDTLKVQGEPDYRFAVAVGVDGATTVAGVGCLRMPSKSFTVWLAFAGTRDGKADPAAQAKEKLAALRKRGWDAVKAAHDQWWADFWKKSFIKLASDDGVADYAANLWYLHLYVMGSGSRGEVPPKFNGGLWTASYDVRTWGECYWHWNQQEASWPLFAANHIELQRPYYDMYGNMLPAVKKWTKTFWETDGAQFQETIPFNGVLEPSGLYTQARGIHPRLPVPLHVRNTNLILSSSAEIAMLFWWQYLYTGDETFLRQRTYPLMKEVAAFYVGYLEKDAQGRYNVYPSNAQEQFWSVKNPTPDLAAIRYLFPVMIEASQRLNLDADLRPIWQDRLNHLAPYSRDSATGAIRAYETDDSKVNSNQGGQNPEQFAVVSFPMMTLGSPDRDLAVKTFHARKHVNTYGWNTDSLIAARLGLAELAPKGAPPQQNGLQWLLQAHAQTYQIHPSGLQCYGGGVAEAYLECSGVFATAVGEMLLQSWGGVIRLGPALPKAWSGDFKLLAMGGFEVSGHAERGKVALAAILSQRGEAVSLANPFEGEAVIAQGRQEILRSAAPILKFPTTAGAIYSIVRAGVPLQPLTVTAQPNDAPKCLVPSSGCWLGRKESANLKGGAQ